MLSFNCEENINILKSWEFSQNFPGEIWVLSDITFFLLKIVIFNSVTKSQYMYCIFQLLQFRHDVPGQNGVVYAPFSLLYSVVGMVD